MTTNLQPDVSQRGTTSLKLNPHQTNPGTTERQHNVKEEEEEDFNDV